MSDRLTAPWKTFCLNTSLGIISLLLLYLGAHVSLARGKKFHAFVSNPHRLSDFLLCLKKTFHRAVAFKWSSAAPRCREEPADVFGVLFANGGLQICVPPFLPPLWCLNDDYFYSKRLYTKNCQVFGVDTVWLSLQTRSQLTAWLRSRRSLLKVSVT